MHGPLYHAPSSCLSLTSDAPAEGWDVLTQFPSKDEGLHTEWALDISKPEDLGSQFTVQVETASAQSAPTATCKWSGSSRPVLNVIGGAKVTPGTGSQPVVFRAAPAGSCQT